MTSSPRVPATWLLISACLVFAHACAQLDGAVDGGGSWVGGSLDDCFAGLPGRVETLMVATKKSADGHLRIRIALDTMGSTYSTTDGITYPWSLIRLGVERNGAVTCVLQSSDLTYTGSSHNCADRASAASGAMTFELLAPDRPTATLTVRNSGAVVEQSVVLTDESCWVATGIGAKSCRSGGPC